ncbi:MAG: endonuclease III [Chloroflexota bacterium]|nr:endonuclease III [Chloroflexota bacterium]
MAEADLQAKAMEMHERLLERYGERPRVPRREPMHELISTMLSHRTTQENEAEAYQNMWERFGSWEAIRDAPEEELIEAIKPANFPEVKAPRIKETLGIIIEERGEPSIDFLADMPTEEALEWLTNLPGVGIKTASLVLLFCFGHPVMPVDTHVHRVTGRVGLIPDKMSANKAHEALLELLPHDDHILFNFHINNLRHGQQLCVWRSPKCEKCPLPSICDWYSQHRTDRPE